MLVRNARKNVLWASIKNAYCKKAKKQRTFEYSHIDKGKIHVPKKSQERLLMCSGLTYDVCE